MGSLADDTEVQRLDGPGRYRARLSGDWAIWGPNGGYLAAVALRAVGAACGLPAPRPASFMCHFLGVAQFAEVELEVTTLRAAKRAESVRVAMTQDGQPILEALVWTVADGLEALAHDAAPMPDVPGPDELPSIEELLPGEPPLFPFWANIEQRPLAFIEDWDNRPAGDPELRGWFRFRPQDVFADPFVDAGRLAVLVDTLQWPAAARAYAEPELEHVAPSIDLACRFHRPAQHAPWLFVRAHSPVADGGLVAGTAAVWGADGRLLASGGQQMLARPIAPRHRPH
jgi:acyl-CoA thioesterase